MTQGFDLDEIERELMLDDLSWWRMNRVTKAGHAAIIAILTEIRELRAENARLREDVRRQTSLAQDHFRNATRLAARAALGEPQ